MLERDSRRRGVTVGQVAWRLGVSPQEYRELEAGKALPTFATWGLDLQAVRVVTELRGRAARLMFQEDAATQDRD
jgi:hypothetical protein